MKRSLIASAALAAVMLAGPVRARTLDVAFTYRMGAGFPGDVNRTHPASITPGLMNTTTPVRLYGDPVLIDSATNSYRGFAVGDTAVVTLKGVLVRPYPTQQTSGGMSAAIGAAVPPSVAGTIVDVIEDGYVMVKCNDFAIAASTKGGAVFIRTAATAANKIQGGFHAGDDGANAIQVTNAEWNGPPDANGIAELKVWKA